MIEFDVLREGSRIGHHRLRFSREGDRLVVEVDVDLAVKFLFFTAYSYEHRVREEWTGERLQRIEAETELNGKTFRVEGRATAEGLRVVDKDGEDRLLPADALATTHWHPRTREAEAMLNTQTGRYMPVGISAGDRLEQVAAPWGAVAARRYQVDAARDWSVWYEPAGALMKIAFTAKDGSAIEYRLRRHLDPRTAVWMADEPLLANYAQSQALQGAGTKGQSQGAAK